MYRRVHRHLTQDTFRLQIDATLSMSMAPHDRHQSCPALAPPGAAVPRLRRWLFAAAGVLCVGLAAVGVVVPGMPATIFLIAASWLFTKSCPWLEDRLIRNRFFRPYLAYLDGNERMPRRTKLATLATMWACVGLSAFLLFEATSTLWPPTVVVMAALVGSVVIVRQGAGCHCRVGSAD